MTSPALTQRIHWLPGLLALGIRLIQGAGAGLAVLLASEFAEWDSLLIATSLCGAAIAVGMDAWLQRKAFRIALCVPLLACHCMLVTVSRANPWALSVLWLGLGITAGSGWGAATNLLKASAPTKLRWHAMGAMVACFGVGLVLVSVDRSLALVPLVGSIPMMLVSGFIALPKIEHEVQSPCSPSPTPTEPPSVTSLPRPAETNPAEASSACESDSTCEEGPGEDGECCGGSARPFVATPFKLGVALQTVGWLLFYCVLANWSAFAKDMHVGIAISFVMGAVVLFAAAPRSGYAVMMMPFALLLLLTGIAAVFVGDGLRSAVVLASSLAIGAVFEAIQAITGESHKGLERARVLTVSLFAAATVVLLNGLLPGDDLLLRVAALQIAAVIVLIVLVRKIPSLMISSLGQSGDESDPEYADVVASLKSDEAN